MKAANSILLVEDDADDVYFISRALRSTGVDVPLHLVNDGDAAVEFLARPRQRLDDAPDGRPALVLLDLNLPHKSGLEVLRWIRQDSDLKTIVVIVLTSSTSDADINQAYSLGANSYIIKPSDATKLKDLGELLKTYWFGWNQIPPACRPGAAAAFA